MTSNTNKDAEQAIIERLRWIYKDLPEGEWSQPDPPEPDFVVTSDRIVGLELTRIFKGGQELKRQESEQDEIVNRSKDLYSNRRHTPVQVYIHWSLWHQPAKKERDGIAEQIASIVEENIPQPGGETELTNLNFSSILPEGVETIIIDRLADYNFNSWSSPRGSIVPKLEPSDLQTVINRKNEKYKHYSGRCERLWLVIVAESNAPSGFCDIPGSTKRHSYSTVFDRVLLFSYSPPQAIELQTKGAMNIGSGTNSPPNLFS